MDPLTHIVIGRAVVALGDREPRPPRGVAWSAVLGALSPDIDSAVALGGWDRYVRIHEFATHSVAGAMALAAVTAVVVTSIARLRDRAALGRRSSAPPGRRPIAPFGMLVAAAFAGALSHLILDIICGGRLQPAWPIAGTRVTVPLVAMADPWFIGICLAGLLARWPARLPWRGVARGIVAVAVLLLAIKGVFLIRASRSAPTSMSLMAIDPHWASLTEWSVFERTPEMVRAWTIDGRGGAAAPAISHNLAVDTHLARASLSLDTVQNFLSVHEFTFPIERRGDDGGSEELWTDLRYCWTTKPDDAAMVRAGDATSCAVWAGGLYDAGGRAIMQLVRIGELVQRRPPR
jgi:membrane-bound metal-dependent hydrolase YbcI (DUF457 family)